jgi:amino acid transporter
MADSDNSFSPVSNNKTTKVVVATTVMLSFISFWRAAAIVLSDLGSSAFYAGGIAEQAIGKAAPWFILGVMLFASCVRAVYVESCTLFTRGGVYRVVKEAVGGTFAKISVSALMFDYILTGPISAVSAGQYIIGLLTQTSEYLHHPWHPDKATGNLISAGIALAVVVYFWWRNTKGIHESSDDALKIMYIASAMIVIMILWSSLTIITHREAQRLPPLPDKSSLSFNHDSLGWIDDLLPGSFVSSKGKPVDTQITTPTPVENNSDRYQLYPEAGTLLGLIGILIAFGHSVLAMSGEETLAQVNRELEHPKHKNLIRAAIVIFVYSMLFTSLVSFFAYALIPDNVRPQYFDNLISGIAMHLSGPHILKLLFQAFIVIVGFLMLSGAANTSIIGSNAVMNRISEDGVLTDWFRAPHKKYGTTYRIINLIALMQIFTVVASRGNIFILGEAYAFGVIWSFTFNSVAMLVLRFKNKSPREWRVPLNLRIGQLELPVGIGAVAMLLFTLACVNLITKQVATISGLLMTGIFFSTFLFSERVNEKKRKLNKHEGLDHFRLQPQEGVSNQTVAVRPGNTLCLVRDYTNLEHVRHALEQTDTESRDLVIVTIHMLRRQDMGATSLDERNVFTDYEQLLFSRVVSLAEKAGKHVDLLVVPAADVFQAIAQTACQLYSAEIIMGQSAVIPASQLALRLGEVWEKLSHKPKHQVRLRIFESSGQFQDFLLGAHAPALTEEEILQIHQLWLDVKMEMRGEVLHHKDIVTISLFTLEKMLKSDERDRLIEEIRKFTAAHAGENQRS